MILVSQSAPNFISSAILGNGKMTSNFNFREFTKNKTVVLFFWPMDFTFVCPSELIAFNNRYQDFKNKKTIIVGISIDSIFVHNAWRNTPIKQGGIGQIKYIMVSDIKRKIQKSYGIEHPKLGISLRGSFLIDKEGIIRHQVINDLPLGRNIDEMLRMVDALHFYEKYGEVCPAQWYKGKKGIIPNNKGIKDYLSNSYKDLN
ncbi:putative peroxiredoxin [Candidatus Annandia adelgestsuga]|uniref:Alkyl hydroperoxide reductase protein C22 n=1 Tax=Candidatus Annandia adelgestsuga TaxID=1302411 RepID=A0A3Q9CLM5_9ENTR|nr:peroxiredoxin C [Candidatus Annandia adelgestsuga]AZP36387.1 putative peroxiredoxin [Candidatus Annandia adelgestsuga]